MDRKELRRVLENSKSTIIDLRDSNSFNGWKLNGEVLEGHIKGALNISANWIDKESLLISEENIVILCYSKDEELTKGFEIFKDMKNLDYFDMRELTLEDKDLVEYYKNYKLLVPPEFLIENKDVKIFHVGFGKEESTSRKGHIKGSVYIDTDEVEPPPLWRIGNKEILEKISEKYGLYYKDKVVITAWDQMAAFRVAFIFEYMGIENVMVLNGGLSYFEKMGYKLSKEKSIVIEENLKTESYKNCSLNKENSKNDDGFGVQIPNKKEIVIKTEEVRANLEKEDFILVDNRTYEEYTGEISGYSYHDKAARIPKAKFGHAGFLGANSLDYYRNIDGTMKSKEDIEHLWREIDLNKKLVFMCGSGWRASEVYFYAKVLGYENIGVYSDGWIGWSSDEKNPTEKG